MSDRGQQRESHNGEKRWKVFEIILATAGVTVAIAGVIVALFLGIGQFRLQKTLVKIAENQTKLQETQKDIAMIAGETAQMEALASLIIALGDPEATVNRLAAKALVQFGKLGEAVVSPLLLILEDKDKEIRLAAVDTLVEIYKRYSGPPYKLSSILLPQVIKLLEVGDNKYAAEACVQLLVKIEKTEELINKLNGVKLNTTLSIVFETLLREIHDIEDFKKLLEHQNFSLISNRIKVSEAISKRCFGRFGKPVVQFLVELTKKEKIDENAKIQIIFTFVDIMDKCSIDTTALIKQALLDLLDDSDRVSTVAVRALKKLCARSEVREAIKYVASQNDVTRTLSREEAQRVLDECRNMES
jgi:hypothetical protein